MPFIQNSYLPDNCCLIMLKSTYIMLHEVLSRNAIAEKKMQGSETPISFAQSSSDDVPAGGVDGVGRTTSGTNEETPSTGGVHGEIYCDMEVLGLLSLALPLP